ALAVSPPRGVISVLLRESATRPATIRSPAMTTQPLTRAFTPPDANTWKQDAAHSPRPLTRWKYETFAEPFVRGFKEGTARYGLMFDHLEPAVVNDFLYYRDRVVDDGAEATRRFEAAKRAFENKSWLEALEPWARQAQPHYSRRH